MLQKEEVYSVVVCGGGLAGFCAAVAAARSGVSTCLIHDRPVFGGNSSSEIRVTPHGAARFHAYARETGLLSELLIELLHHNHELMDNGGHNTVWDRVLYNMAMETENLKFYLNTSVVAVNKSSERRIDSIAARISNAEVELTLRADVFIDCTGDGIVADLAGCEWSMGTESRSDTLEPHASTEASDGVMGSSIHFKAVDTGRPAPFKLPSWAISYDDASFFYEKGRGISKVNQGYWWLTISLPWQTIHDNEQIRHELTRHVLGVWDWIKNKDPKLKDKAANMALDWVGQVPGKRETRRIKGLHVLNEHDVQSRTPFPDEVAYAGWYIDLHSPYGLLDKMRPELVCETKEEDKPSLVCGPYALPLRMLIAKDADNLMMAGRNVSVTHVALGTVRVMATTALMGQGAGTAAAYAIRQGTSLSKLPYDRQGMACIQQKLLRSGCFLLHSVNEDTEDLARNAKVSASSEACLYGVGPDSKGYVLDIKKWNREKGVDKNEPKPGANDELLQRRGQWIAIGTERIDRISVCLSNTSAIPQKVLAKIVLADSIWDYRVREGEMMLLAVKELSVEPGTLQWVDWELRGAADFHHAVGKYIRLDLYPNPNVMWHCAGAIVPGMMSGYDTGSQMRRYKYGQTMSFRISPPQPCYQALNILSGVTRPYKYTNVWRSDPQEPLPQWIQLEWESDNKISQVELTFAGHLFREFEHAGETSFYQDPQTVKDYRIAGWIQGRWEQLITIEDNYHRHRIHKLPQSAETSRLRLDILATNGDPSAILYEIRCYR